MPLCKCKLESLYAAIEKLDEMYSQLTGEEWSCLPAELDVFAGALSTIIHRKRHGASAHGFGGLAANPPEGVSI